MTTNPQTEARDRAAANEASTATDRATAAGQNMTFAVSVPASAPTDWIDGHPQLEAIAAAVWERCGRSDSGTCVEDDPRNIAVAALAAVLPAPTDRAAILREAAAAIEEAQHLRDDTVNAALGFLDNNTEQQHRAVHRSSALLRRMADAAAASGSGRVADETQAEPESGCAHCGGPHAWDDCEVYAALVASDLPTETGYGPSAEELAGHLAAQRISVLQGACRILGWRLSLALVEDDQPAVVSQPDGEA